MKKIVILNGSPRRNGNTSALVKAFTQGAESAGNTVTEFFLDSMEIHGCRGCFGGHSSQECPCVQKDDMSQIYPAVKESDVVVLATPLYYWNMSGQIRTAIDRLFALEEGDGNLLRGHERASALLMAAEGNGFDDVLLYYNHLVEHLRWKNLGHVLAGGNGDIGDIEGKPEIQKACDLGKSIQ
ncbi:MULTISPECIES: flavodoxin family protein [Anaerostipes]|uniref:NADPH-dependent FMN reductase-like domain-containing protein n=1 Tax=Anaerostipes butyraticus TaxID=645466 RepID=A0A916Q7C4_9FIRM|nr:MULTISPECIES: flavodoxin family protein [Anaerostipes]GFO83906.1 hypothetical protein ANBU17_02530 [Anaerostipes butyraticus]HJC83425.1 flavodoxin family protein [Candidatus Anaerostipes avicola]